MELNSSLLVFICVIVFANGHLFVDMESSRTFDQELYKRVLDSEECDKQMNFMRRNETSGNLFARFLEAGVRIPRSLFLLGNTDLGNYHQCLRISEEMEDMKIEGKYVFLEVPLNQTFQLELPFGDEIINLPRRIDFTNTKIVRFDNDIIADVQSFAIAKREGDGNKVEPTDLVKRATLNLAICVPKVCTSLEFAQRALFNLSTVGFRFEEQFVRLPNDKPWVPADWVAIGIYSFILFVTVLGTAYDVIYLFVQKKDPKNSIIYLRMFSVYTNTRRLMTFVPNATAIDCMDGIRSISMLWVVVGHAFSMHNFNLNLLDGINWVTSADAVWISTGLFAVDTFYMMAGLLLVYVSVGKMSGTTLLKHLHIFYLNRLLRIFPLLASVVLFEASVFHRMVDGPYWVKVARNVERCRTFWWTTLLHVQNYVNPEDMCIAHSWYIAIDIQLHIVSPIILFWVLGKSKKAAWSALVSGLLAVLVASTIWNFMKNMPSTNMTIPRLDEQMYYMNNYYVLAWTRAAPFFIGMIFGYVLNIYKGKEIRLNQFFVMVAWLISLGMIAFCFYASYEIMKLDWDNQTGDNLFNSFSRAIWAVGVGWIIFACAKGYGGPINWFLSLSIWKFPARISYAMYLYHYPIMFVAAGMQVMPQYFSQGTRIFEFMAFLVISFWVAYLVTVIIDAPCSILIKMALEGGRKKSRPTPEKVADTSKSGSPPEKDMSLLENNIIRITTLQKDDDILKNNDFQLQKNGPNLQNNNHLLMNGQIVASNDGSVEENGHIIKKDEILDKDDNTNLERKLSLQREDESDHVDKVDIVSELDTKEVSKF